MEYPGYGIYKSEDTSESNILRDADKLMKFLLYTVKIPINRIIVLGRSIGSGPATFVAKKYKPAALFLVSAFTSIKKVVKNLYGILGEMLVKERFNNLERMKSVKCPVLIIHGK